MAGRIAHYEIPADDTSQALEFRGSLFEWNFEAFDGSPTEYHVTPIDETAGAAITGMEPGRRGPRA